MSSKVQTWFSRTACLFLFCQKRDTVPYLTLHAVLLLGYCSVLQTVHKRRRCTRDYTWKCFLSLLLTGESERGARELYWSRVKQRSRTQRNSASNAPESILFKLLGILGKLFRGYSIYQITQMFQKMKKKIWHLSGGMTNRPLWQQLRSTHWHTVTATTTVPFWGLLLITSNLRPQWIGVKLKQGIKWKTILVKNNLLKMHFLEHIIICSPGSMFPVGCWHIHPNFLGGMRFPKIIFISAHLTKEL